MEPIDPPPAGDRDEDEVLADLGHPKGTLAIVLIYGLLFALGWALLYFAEFVPRGLPQ